MNVVYNLRMLGVQPDTKKSLTGTFALKFDIHKVKEISNLSTWFFIGTLCLKNICLSFQKKRAARKDRSGEEETWQLSRFYPMVEVCIKLKYCQISLHKVCSNIMEILPGG